MLLVLVVALVVVGPKDLPKVMRKMGQWAAKARNMADQFRSSFDEMARQSELDELRKELDELRNTRPLADTEQAIHDTLHGPAVSFEKETPGDEPHVEPDAGPEAGPHDAAPAETAPHEEAAHEGAAHEAAPEPQKPAEPIPEGDQRPPRP